MLIKNIFNVSLKIKFKVLGKRIILIQIEFIFIPCLNVRVDQKIINKSGKKR